MIQLSIWMNLFYLVIFISKLCFCFPLIQVSRGVFKNKILNTRIKILIVEVSVVDLLWFQDEHGFKKMRWCCLHSRNDTKIGFWCHMAFSDGVIPRGIYKKRLNVNIRFQIILNNSLRYSSALSALDK